MVGAGRPRMVKWASWEHWENWAGWLMAARPAWLVAASRMVRTREAGDREGVSEEEAIARAWVGVSGLSSSRLLVFSSSRLLVRKTGTTTTRSRAEKKNSPKLAHDLSLCTLYDTTHVGCIRTMSVSSVGRGRSRAGAETGLALALDLARSTSDPPTRKPPGGVFAPAVSRFSR